MYIIKNREMEKFDKNKIIDVKDKKESKEEIEIREFKLSVVKLQTELKKFPNNRIEFGKNIVRYDSWIVHMGDNTIIRGKQINYEFNNWWINFTFWDKITQSFVKFKLDYHLDLEEFSALRMVGEVNSDYEVSYNRWGNNQERYSKIRRDKWRVEWYTDPQVKKEVKKYIDIMLDIIEKYKKTEKAKVELKNLKSEIKK